MVLVTYSTLSFDTNLYYIQHFIGEYNFKFYVIISQHVYEGPYDLAILVHVLHDAYQIGSSLVSRQVLVYVKSSPS